MDIYIRQLIGFSGVGFLVTFIGIALTYIFIEVWGIPLFTSYLIIYAGTILLSYIINSVLVFKAQLGLTALVKYFVVYLTGMMIGMLTLLVYKYTIPLESWILAYMVIPITTLWNYFFSKKILENRRM